MKNICKICNTEFESKRKKQCCSDKCYSKYKYYNMKKYNIICKNCKKNFLSYRKDLECCSKKCATQLYRNKNREKITIDDLSNYIKDNQVSIGEIEKTFNISTRKIYYLLEEQGINSYKEFIGLVNGVYIEKSRSDTSLSAIKCFDTIKEILKSDYQLEKEFNDLKNQQTNRKLRIDCYFEKYNLAIEYNGIQHFKYIPYFHKGKNTLEYQRYKDKIKEEFCKNNNITLIKLKYNDDLSKDNLKKILAEAISNQAKGNQ